MELYYVEAFFLVESDPGGTAYVRGVYVGDAEPDRRTSKKVNDAFGVPVVWDSLEGGPYVDASECPSHDPDYDAALIELATKIGREQMALRARAVRDAWKAQGAA